MNAAPPAPPRADAAARRWRKAFFGSSTFLRVVGLLLLAALVFGAYFTQWVLSREAYFTTRNFRILAGLSKQIESIIAVHSDGLRYGALGQQVEEPARQAAELSISYRGSADAQETRRLRLTSGVAPPPKEAKADQDTGKPLLGF